MKKSIYGIVAVCLFTVWACDTKPSETAQKPGPSKNPGKDTAETLYAVPIEIVTKNIKHYDTVARKALGTVPIQSFTIRSVDLLEAMGMPVADTTEAVFKYVRIYLGMNKKNDFKLYLTPVVGANLNVKPPIAGRDSILHGKFKGLGGSGDYMLDFTQSCPNTCPN